LEELERTSGPKAYIDAPMRLGPNLMGEVDTPVVTVTLEQAIQMAARNNLDVQLARLQPAISEARIVQAEAVFDAVYFAEFTHDRLDTPGPPSLFPGIGGTTQSRDTVFRTGIRKVLSSGGQVSVQTEMGRS